MTASDEKSGPGKRHGNRHGATRSQARLMAVQALYQMDIAQTDLNDIIAEFSSTRLDDRDETTRDVDFSEPYDQVFFTDLAKGVVARQRDIDPLIQSHLAEGWHLTRVDSTLRAILRAGAYEIVGRDDVPAKVVINEYLDVAHAFFDDDVPRVVNGVLDRLARELRPSEFGKTVGA